ncbi:MAG: hypothetical protein PHD76_01810 [Methylacidiphilales bacterium]|nr:hypothetical protein [Candidatus Methylacidiphilales bacterium]
MKLRTQLLLQPAHHTFLKRKALERNSSISAALRDLLDEKMSESKAVTENDPVLKLVAKYASGYSDTSRRSKEILYGNSSR